MEDLNTLHAKVLKLESRIAAIEVLLGDRSDSNTTLGLKEMSVREFILGKKLSGDVQKTLAIAYYLEKYQGVTSFNVEDLAHYFQLAKEPVPQNLNDKINMNIKKGHVMESKEKKDNKKAWVITNSGENFISQIGK